MWPSHSSSVLSKYPVNIFLPEQSLWGFVFISPIHPTIPETLRRYTTLRALNVILRTWRLILSCKWNCWELLIKAETQCGWYFKKKNPRGDYKLVMGRTDWMQDNQHGRRKTAEWNLLYNRGLGIWVPGLPDVISVPLSIPPLGVLSYLWKKQITNHSGPSYQVDVRTLQNNECQSAL